ncbi:MAG: hypothetical protein K2G55_03485, partial [Lachnospiraceae bacterium]|nr:hypothetical protein [Lachnospiraceae bacterium]
LSTRRRQRHMCIIERYRGNDIVKRDIEKAAKVLFGKSLRSGLCLCHGMAGNYMIMKEYQKHYSLDAEQEVSKMTIGSEIINTILEDRMLPQDRYSMGLMTGLSGIGVCLGDMLKENDNISQYMTE